MAKDYILFRRMGVKPRALREVVHYSALETVANCSCPEVSGLLKRRNDNQVGEEEVWHQSSTVSRALERVKPWGVISDKHDGASHL